MSAQTSRLMEVWMARVVCSLVFFALVLGAFGLAVKDAAINPAPRGSSAQTASQPRPGAGEQQGLDVGPKGENIGPYESWPLSFPKILPGFFLLENEAPQLALTKEQAREILPLIEEMAQNWSTVHTVEIKIKQLLTPAQRAWILSVKHEVEQGQYIEAVSAYAGAVKPGENGSVIATLRICSEKLPATLPADLAAKATAARKRVLDPNDYMQSAGEEWLTVFDECTAFYWIEKEHPDLRLSTEQAAQIEAILQDVKEPLRIVEEDFKKVCTYLTDEQKKYVQDHMAQLYLYRTGKIKTKDGQVLTFTETAINRDADKYHDPLYYVTVNYLRAVVDSK